MPAMELDHRFGYRHRVMGLQTRIRRVGSRVLSERGLAAIWQLHLDALSAHLAGLPDAAALLLAIADAPEDLAWWRPQISEAPERNA